MKKQASNSLSFKLIKLGVVLTFLVSLLLSSIQVVIDYGQQQKELGSIINKILRVSEHTAAQAVVNEDSDLATEVVKSLLEYQFVSEVKIFDKTGNLLALEQVQPLPSNTGFMTRLLTAETQQYLIPLHEHGAHSQKNLNDIPGMLYVTIDHDHLLAPFYKRSIYLFLSDIIRNLILVGILLVIFRLFLTKPLTSLISEIQSIDPKSPQTQYLQTDTSKQTDEFKLLANSCNKLIQSVEQQITERKQTEVELLKSEELLKATNRLARVGGWEYDIEREELHWSAELCRILDLPICKKLDLNDIYKQISPEHKKQVDAAVANSLRTDQPFQIELSITHSLGDVVWVRAIGKASAILGQPIWTCGMLQDITESRISEQALKLRDFALNQAPDAILTIDSEGHILTANDTTYSRYKFSKEELIGETLTFLNPEFDMSYWANWWETLKNKSFLITQSNNTKKDGQNFPVEITTGHFVYDENEFCVMSIKDITLRKQQDDEIQHLAYHDALTGLPNRSLLQDRLSQAMVAAKRHNHTGAVLFIDLDNFKKINDSLGHSAGDKVLQELANRLTSHLRDEDTVSRLGGDEFVVISPHLEQAHKDALTKAEDLGHKLLSIVSRPFFIAGQELHITASIGLALFPNQYETAAEVLQFADTAMYNAKADGRDTIALFTPNMAKDASRKLSLENQLRNALNNNEYTLNFQPQYDDNENIVGAETLLRWHSPVLGTVSPAEFIPILETTGLILPVGEWVLSMACKQVKTWINNGLWHEDIALGINISPEQFKQEHFLDQIAMCLEQTSIPPKCIELEITEGMVIHNVDDIIAKLKQLRELGVQVSIDDFGTGYSSLSYLKRLPIDTLKIDQSFIKDIPDDSDASAIVTTIISMAQQLNLSVIAEGVETKEQLTYLYKNNCMLYQGYYFNRPMPAQELEILLNDTSSLKTSAQL